MPLGRDYQELITRRHFFGRSAGGIGVAALATLLEGSLPAAPPAAWPALPGLPHHPPRAKRVIFMHQSGAPSQLDLFDPKPQLDEWHGQEIPDSVRQKQRLTDMTANQERKPVTQSLFRFARHGASGTSVSELLPFTARVVDDLCVVRSLHTEAINHDPGITFFQTGSQQPGRPSMGSWLSYGLGSENDNLPAFTVLISGGQPGDQPLMGRLWGSGFLASRHQGVNFRGVGDPILYLKNPPGINSQRRRAMLDGMARLNRLQQEAFGDPAIEDRIAQFEMAHRMQMSVPELVDLADEPERTYQLYGEEARMPGTYAANCLLARRLVERGVRFVQLYHRGWDHHSSLPGRIRTKCQQTDQPSAGLVEDLKQRGLLEDTLLVWAGEFGRTVYCQGDLQMDDYGRDHHPRCFSAWLSGGGLKRGLTYGVTDDFSYNITENPVHVHDLQATILHLLGIDHERLIYRFQGRDHRLTDIGGRLVKDLLA
ncbi:MAG: DUF1501 domain-containing protein [Planctomycetota bacterium]|nr:DUF1501 domain-containing protein [Planctomycetota bacterium]